MNENNKLRFNHMKLSQCFLIWGIMNSFALIEQLQAETTAFQVVQQQLITVKGTVKDSHGELLIGANVIAD